MKTYILNKLRFLPVLSMLILFTACDLELQEGYDFVPEVDAIDPFDDITAWEWVQTRTALLEDGSLNGEEMNYMIAAIKRAGMENEYNNSSIVNRTYLMLNNNAFTGSGDVIQLVTGSATVGPDETPDDVMARADVEVLKLVLNYHIVDAYVAQIPTLFQYNVDYLFQTLIPGEDGLIAMRRNERYFISINNSNAPLPTSATSQSENVRGHNYVFSNGIGHIIADPVRNQPYPAPSVP